MRKLFCICLLLFTGLVRADHAGISFETGVAGAIMTTSGSTLERGRSYAGLEWQFLKLDELSDAELEAAGARDEDLHSVNSLIRFAINFTHGITDNLMAGFSIPYIKRDDVREAHHDMGMGEAEFAGDSEGIGDVRLFSQYRFYSTAGLNIALMGGLKIPSGEDEERELEGGVFATEQQPGSGSWDPFIGISHDMSLNGFGISSSLLYTFATDGAQGVDQGDSFSYNLALSYRIYSPEGPHNHHQHVHAMGMVDNIDLILEINGDYRQKANMDSIKDDNTGGHTVYLSPGVRAGIGHDWSVYASAGIPVVNDLNGQQSEPDYRIFAGLGKQF